MRILVVDDEELARSRLRNLLDDIADCETIGEAKNGREALRFVNESMPDLVMMDIRMPVMDGLEAARHLNRLELMPLIIFTTAYEEHALRAFDENAVDYLVKPIRRDRLEKAIGKAQRNLSVADEIRLPVENDTARSHICARYLGVLKLVPIDDIVYFRAEHKYVTVCHEHGEVLIEDPLKQLELEFGNRFLRIHRSILVAMNRITGLEKGPEGNPVIRLKGAEKSLDISRRNLPAVRKILKSL